MTLRVALAAALAGLAACSAPLPYDYGVYLAHMPRSILVLPPLNESPDAAASYALLAGLTRPLAERGYYVFPVAVVDELMRTNGLPTPYEMHQVSLAKIHEVIGADAVLYATVLEWGTSYQVINSTTRARVHYRLVDVRDGVLLWDGEESVVANSGGGSTDPIGALIGAVVNQVATSVSDPTPALSESGARQLFADERRGLLPGPLHPDHEASLRARRAASSPATPENPPANAPAETNAAEGAEPAEGSEGRAATSATKGTSGGALP